MAKMLYEDANIAAVADGLRMKADESGEAFTTAQMRDAVLRLSYANIPTYHHAEAGRVIKALLDFKAAHPHNLIFGAVSDCHVYHADDTYEAQTARSTRHAAFALETVAAAVGCDFIVNLGDNVWENDIDTDNAYAGLMYVNDAIRAAFERLPSYRLLGNHDKSTDTQKTYDAVGAYNDFDAVGTVATRGFGYKDDAAKKVRVICLNTTDYINREGGCALSYDQKDFLMRALDLSGKADADEWQILLLSHIPLDHPSGDFHFTADLQAILSAYVNGTTVSITVNDAHAAGEDPTAYATYKDGALVYDYVGKNAARIIANVHGHKHTNSIAPMDQSGIWRVSVMNACFSLNIDEAEAEAGYGYMEGDYGRLKKIAGTEADTSVTFVCVDLEQQLLTVFIYGAGGADVTHSIVYGDKAAHTVTYVLTGCQSSNAVTIANEGSVYEAVLIAETGTVLDRVTVTMGGEDITERAVLGGMIRIAEVTGDIVITATASAAMWTQTVADAVIAPRSTWGYDASNGGFSFYNDNTRLAIGVSTASEFAYTDREGNPIYVMPVPAEASRVKVVSTDGVSYQYSYWLLNTVDGALVCAANSGWVTDAEYGFTAGIGQYIAIAADTLDDTGVPWGYDDTQIAVMFTNE